MKTIEDRDLDAVAGADTQQDLLEFILRVQRDAERLLFQPTDPGGY